MFSEAINYDEYNILLLFGRSRKRYKDENARVPTRLTVPGWISPCNKKMKKKKNTTEDVIHTVLLDGELGVYQTKNDSERSVQG